MGQGSAIWDTERLDQPTGIIGSSSPLPLPLFPSTLQGEEFLYQATEVKNIWIPMGEIFAN